MARFWVDFEQTVSFGCEVEAEDRHAALTAAYKRLHAEASMEHDWTTEGVSLMSTNEDGDDVEEAAWAVIGECESCQRECFDDEATVTIGEDDGEGGVVADGFLCPKCGKAAWA